MEQHTLKGTSWFTKLVPTTVNEQQASFYATNVINTNKTGTITLNTGKLPNNIPNMSIDLFSNVFIYGSCDGDPTKYTSFYILVITDIVNVMPGWAVHWAWDSSVWNQFYKSLTCAYQLSVIPMNDNVKVTKEDIDIFTPLPLNNSQLGNSYDLNITQLTVPGKGVKFNDLSVPINFNDDVLPFTPQYGHEIPNTNGLQNYSVQSSVNGGGYGITPGPFVNFPMLGVLDNSMIHNNGNNDNNGKTKVNFQTIHAFRITDQSSVFTSDSLSLQFILNGFYFYADISRQYEGTYGPWGPWGYNLISDGSDHFSKNVQIGNGKNLTDFLNGITTPPSIADCYSYFG